MASQSTLLGAAGEYYLMSELLRRGYIAALAPGGAPHADIVVTDVEGARLCSIQVKTRRDIGSDGGWHMREKHEQIRGERLFYCYCLVDFPRRCAGCCRITGEYLVPTIRILSGGLVTIGMHGTSWGLRPPIRGWNRITLRPTASDKAMDENESRT